MMRLGSRGWARQSTPRLLGPRMPSPTHPPGTRGPAGATHRSRDGIRFRFRVTLLSLFQAHPPTIAPSVLSAVAAVSGRNGLTSQAPPAPGTMGGDKSARAQAQAVIQAHAHHLPFLSGPPEGVPQVPADPVLGPQSRWVDASLGVFRPATPEVPHPTTAPTRGPSSSDRHRFPNVFGSQAPGSTREGSWWAHSGQEGESWRWHGLSSTLPYPTRSEWLLVLPLAGHTLGFIPRSLRLGMLSPITPQAVSGTGSLLRGAPVPLVTTHLPPLLLQELWWTSPAPPTPTEGRGRGHAVTFPFNSLVGPPVVEGWSARAPATQSP